MSQRQSFRSLDKFAIYYGAGSVDRLMQYDAVVLEPAHRSLDEIRALKHGGALVLAYVSVMEVHSQHPLREFVRDEEYLRDTQPPYARIVEHEYANLMVDLRSTSWRGHLLRHIGQLLTIDAYDGVFLDTIGDVEMSTLPHAMQQVEAATTLVQQIRKWFPEAILVQNNGLELLCTRTAQYLDAITWENPPVDIPESRAWVNAVAERLTRIRLIHPLRILVLFEGDRQDTRIDFLRGREFAQTHGFTPYFSPKHYQNFHNT